MFLSGTATRNLQPHKIYCQNYNIIHITNFQWSYLQPATRNQIKYIVRITLYISNVENYIVYKMSNGVTY